MDSSYPRCEANHEEPTHPVGNLQAIKLTARRANPIQHQHCTDEGRTARPDPKNQATATLPVAVFSRCNLSRMTDEVAGVITTTVGYTGGPVVNSTCEQVASETTGRAESGEVIFDTARICADQRCQIVGRVLERD